MNKKNSSANDQNPTEPSKASGSEGRPTPSALSDELDALFRKTEMPIARALRQADSVGRRLAERQYPIDLGELTIRRRHHTYVVTRHLVREHKVQLTVSVDRVIVGQRMTGYPYLWAAAIYLVDPVQIADLQAKLKSLDGIPDYYDAIQLRDPVALVRDEKAHCLDSPGLRRHLAEREERIRLGHFGALARAYRRDCAAIERRLNSVPVGPRNESLRPYILSWHLSYDLALRGSRGACLADIVEIPTGLAIGANSPKKARTLYALP